MRWDKMLDVQNCLFQYSFREYCLCVSFMVFWWPMFVCSYNNCEGVSLKRSFLMRKWSHVFMSASGPYSLVSCVTPRCQCYVHWLTLCLRAATQRGLRLGLRKQRMLLLPWLETRPFSSRYGCCITTVFRLHRMHEMLPVVIYGVCASVSLSVTQSNSASLCKKGCLGWTLLGAHWTLCYMGVLIHHRGGSCPKMGPKG